VGGIGPLQGLGTMGAHLTPALSPTPGPPGSTRKLYERKICEYESQRTKLSPPGGYSGEWGARRGGEGPAAAATDLPPFLCVSSLPTPDPATTETYIRESYRCGGNTKAGRGVWYDSPGPGLACHPPTPVPCSHSCSREFQGWRSSGEGESHAQPPISPHSSPPPDVDKESSSSSSSWLYGAPVSPLLGAGGRGLGCDLPR
uniref:Uncharacterized protein n=1 Tax=Chelonoidis abingdonii TaxID=106734 RepID=A0A8C0IUJ7_CHEAB